jgi:hypothetical protein
MTPTTREEYQERFDTNQTITGYGLGTTLHVPCPFCAAKDFFVFPILDTSETMAKGAVCAECGRGAKAVFDNQPGQVKFEMMQTCGEDPPAWLTPKMRRLA